jgi:hypothetical protein
MTGAVVDDPQQKVATIRTGLEFEVRSADNSCELKIDGFEGILLSNLTEKRVATLRFTEGFVNAFKSRAPILRYSWNTHEGDAVCTGESTSLCAVFAPHQGDMRVAGMADSGTCLQAKFSYLRTGLRLFVSTHELGHGEHACLLPSDAENSERVSLMIGDVEVRELPICDGCADAVWEVTNPFCAERSATSLEFAVFASYASNSNNPPFIGSSLVAGGFFPAVACFANGPIPEFSGIFTMFPRRFLTIGA